MCQADACRWGLASITNDIYTKEDAEFLTCAATAARAHPRRRDRRLSTHRNPRGRLINLAAVADLRAAFPDLDLIFVESGGDNLAATFSPELADLTIYVIDVAGGDKIPRKGGPGITR